MTQTKTPHLTLITLDPPNHQTTEVRSMNTEEATGVMDAHTEELAKRLCAAAISMGMGISYQTAYKSYTEKHPHIGGYWISLAEKVIDDGLAT